MQTFYWNTAHTHTHTHFGGDTAKIVNMFQQDIEYYITIYFIHIRIRVRLYSILPCIWISLNRTDIFGPKCWADLLKSKNKTEWNRRTTLPLCVRDYEYVFRRMRMDGRPRERVFVLAVFRTHPHSRRWAHAPARSNLEEHIWIFENNVNPNAK